MDENEVTGAENEGTGAGNGAPQLQDFISRLVPDPNNPPDALLLVGYVGASSEPGYTRLYFDVVASSYVEIPDDAILYTEPVPGQQPPLGLTYVWIRGDAELIYGKPGQESRPRGRFLEGPIMQEGSGTGQGSQGEGQAGGQEGVPQSQSPEGHCGPILSADIYCRCTIVQPTCHHLISAPPCPRLAQCPPNWNCGGGGVGGG